jgi:hypothetical protein
MHDLSLVVGLVELDILPVETLTSIEFSFLEFEGQLQLRPGQNFFHHARSFIGALIQFFPECAFLLNHGRNHIGLACYVFQQGHIAGSDIKDYMAGLT